MGAYAALRVFLRPDWTKRLFAPALLMGVCTMAAFLLRANNALPLAALTLALALCLDPLQPINKKLWTPAFVFAAGAYSLGMFALFYYIIDVCQWRRWSYFFKVIGVNSITIYMVQRIVRVSYTSEFFFGGRRGSLGGVRRRLLAAAVVPRPEKDIPQDLTAPPQ